MNVKHVEVCGSSKCVDTRKKNAETNVKSSSLHLSQRHKESQLHLFLPAAPVAKMAASGLRVSAGLAKSFKA